MLEKKYNHQTVEKDRYNEWNKKGYFTSGDLSKKPFCIVIPPPNVTGILHLGHAWDGTLQDIITRYKRMQGYDALWLPGMDHAGIATQAKVDAKLRAADINPRTLDRDQWLNYAWEWKEEYANTIRGQWAKLGLSLDYTKERFTMDEGLSKAVNKVFIDLYNKGYIYRGKRIINWDPMAMTALSNIEVIYKEVPGKFYHIKYQLENSDQYLEVATTRPETLFGDVAVAVNPEDDRYKHLIGQSVILPIVNKKIPIIGDEHADKEFGTGVVKITPAHDPNDYEVGLRHNLEQVVIMNQDATMNENTGKYNGLDRFIARDKVVEELQDLNLLIKTEEIVHNVGFSERTDVMVEPYLSYQWFVKMDDLASNALNLQKDPDKKANFVPPRYEKIFTNWMENIQDWCISRQLIWGHRIPAWYKDDEIYVGHTAPLEEGWVQDPDVLDTWFSSALWPFSTLGWPEETADFKRYFPTDVLVTGYDIIFFWVSRMIFESLEFTGKRPFKEVLIHGLIRDKTGRKMSKSLGNGVDPMKVCEEYGADSLRWFLTTNTAPGTDLRYDPEKVKASWNFINKLWNASRFVLMTTEDITITPFEKEELSIYDRWILNRLNETIKNLEQQMEKYEFNLAGTTIYNFVWNDFCDWYIELVKGTTSQTTKNVLVDVLSNILRLLHPFIPYVTEEIYQALPNKQASSIMIDHYPKVNPTYQDTTINEEIDHLFELIREIRNKKAEKELKEYNIICKDQTFLQNHQQILMKLLKLTEANFKQESDPKETVIPLTVTFTTIELSFEETINIEAERQKLETEKEAIQQIILRRTKLLNNENYTKKAPLQIVEKERFDLAENQKQLEKIEQSLKELEETL